MRDEICSGELGMQELGTPTWLLLTPPHGHWEGLNTSLIRTLGPWAGGESEIGEKELGGPKGSPTWATGGVWLFPPMGWSLRGERPGTPSAGWTPRGHYVSCHHNRPGAAISHRLEVQVKPPAVWPPRREHTKKGADSRSPKHMLEELEGGCLRARLEVGGFSAAQSPVYGLAMATSLQGFSRNKVKKIFMKWSSLIPHHSFIHSFIQSVSHRYTSANAVTSPPLHPIWMKRAQPWMSFLMCFPRWRYNSRALPDRPAQQLWRLSWTSTRGTPGKPSVSLMELISHLCRQLFRSAPLWSNLQHQPPPPERLPAINPALRQQANRLIL